jgi:hypothetical protein
MKKSLVAAGLVVLGMASMATPAHAFGRRGCRDRDCAAPCAPVETQWVEKTITCYKPVWKERDVKVTINHCVPKDVVTKHTATVMVAEWKDEKKKVTVNTWVPKEVEREVVTCHKVPVCPAPCDSCDDCNRRHRLLGRRGCEAPYQVVQEVHKVKCTVMECKPVEKEITVKVCSWKPTEKKWETHHTVWENKPETVTRKQKYCEMVAYETKVKVPVCTPCCR